MILRTNTLAAAALLGAAALVGANAGAATPAAKPAARSAAGVPAKPGQASASATTEVEHATLYLKVLISALQSEQVPQPAKATLVGCIYSNSLSRITDSLDKLIAQNPDKVHRDKPNELAEAMLAICGFKGEARAQAPAPAAPAPAQAPAAAKPVGR